MHSLATIKLMVVFYRKSFDQGGVQIPVAMDHARCILNSCNFLFADQQVTRCGGYDRPSRAAAEANVRLAPWSGPCIPVPDRESAPKATCAPA